MYVRERERGTNTAFTLHRYATTFHRAGCTQTLLQMAEARPAVQQAANSPNLLRLISSGETGRSFLSALISSNILSWRLRGRGGVGFSFLAETLGKKKVMAIDFSSCP